MWIDHSKVTAGLSARLAATAPGLAIGRNLGIRIVQGIARTVVVATAAGLLGGCDERDQNTKAASPAAFPSNAVARVGDRVITADALSARLAQRGVASDHSAAEHKRAVLNDLITFELLLAQARARDYEQRPEVREMVEKLMVTRFLEDQLAEDAGGLVTEADIENEYRRQAARFSTPESARAAVIVFRVSPKASSERLAEMRRKAESVLAEARAADPVAFARIVQTHSEDQATRYRGGDTGWLKRGVAAGWDAAVIDAIFSLAQPGDFAPVLGTSQGFYVIKLLEKQAAAMRPLGEVREGLRYQLIQQRRERRRQELIEQARRTTSVEINQVLLDRMPSPAQASTNAPPRLPEE